VRKELRRGFNQAFTPERYQEFLEQLDRVAGTHIGFRSCETPCFFSKGLLTRLAATGSELIHQLVDDPAYRRISDQALPERYAVPNQPPFPMFVQVDFGLVIDDHGHYQPKLVEIQGFPSLYAFQPALAQAYIDAYGLPRDLEYMLNGFDRTNYRAFLKRAIVANHDPANVVLLELDPKRQKTLCDFTLTEKMTGVRAVCITKLKKQGNRLFYDRDGQLTPIHRIYNRVIVDELERKRAEIPFDWRDPLEVEWAGHPNYYFRISKFSLPYLKHPSVPRTEFLDQVKQLPKDLDNWVLKPLYSFAGLGVLVGPTREQVEAVPPAERSKYILQERIRFTPSVETPFGLTNAEIRVMYVWLDELVPVTTIIRMGRGKMMGVDHNKNMEWVGASAALYDRAS
jgi:hypothetical protein